MKESRKTFHQDQDEDREGEEEEEEHIGGDGSNVAVQTESVTEDHGPEDVGQFCNSVLTTMSLSLCLCLPKNLRA